MKKFFEKPTQLSLKESDQSEDNSLFNDFKDSLKLSILPPQGICLACVVNDNFVVPNIIELTALLSIIVERRFKYNTKLLFPVDIQTNMQGDIINLESIPIFNQKQTDTIEYLSLQYGMFIKTQQGCLMSTIWKEAKRISSTISQDIIFSGIEKQESLMDYMLDPYYNVELDDQMWTGWIVINGYIDWDKDLFDHPQNWQELLLLIQQFTQYGDEQFNQIIANTLGKKYLNGW
ncbi:hypothetical protein SS50377_25539 [Spironucleus salmonicida]|nr:hypothetical protein SS50377_25539 [Spironucleus salmonicida]